MEYEEDLVIDIDSSDLKDPLAVVEYIDDIIAYYRKNEVSFVLTNIYIFFFKHILVNCNAGVIRIGKMSNPHRK